MNQVFKLEQSRWYSLMKLGLDCRNCRVSAEGITKWAPILATFEYEPSAGTELAKAELALSDALLAVKVMRAAYERMTNTKPALVAAE